MSDIDLHATVARVKVGDEVTATFHCYDERKTYAVVGTVWMDPQRCLAVGDNLVRFWDGRPAYKLTDLVINRPAPDTEIAANHDCLCPMSWGCSLDDPTRHDNGYSCSACERSCDCIAIRKMREDLLGLLESAWIHGLEAMDPLDPHTYKVLRNALTGDTHA